MRLTEREKVAHLLRRFGLGASEAEIAYYGEGGYARAVERLLDYESVEEGFPVQLAHLRSGKNNNVQMPSVVLWWTSRLLMTRRPLQEKMTLFWHDHFATSASKVAAPLLMAQQNETIRRTATGSFRTLLKEVSQDPAMLYWLDNQENVKGKPNENFAREVMELFTLGIGHYTEQDVQEAARAFTGWSLRRQRDPEMGGAVGSFFLRQRLHDEQPKTVLGKTGNLGGEDVLDHLCDQPRTAEYLVEKMLAWFVAPKPKADTVRRFARIFHEADLQIEPLLREIMLSPEFVSEGSVRSIVKSPVDFVVPTLRQLGIGEAMARAYNPESPRKALAPAQAAAQSMKAMGMWLLYPPDVAGWEGGQSWISTATMVERMRWSERLFRAYPVARVFGSPEPEVLVRRAADIFDAPISAQKFQAVVDAARRTEAAALPAKAASVARLLFSLPEFQMS
ncbi:MAG TPA: DUF1800 domain-containing protein [Fimbriimonas sp.]